MFVNQGHVCNDVNVTRLPAEVAEMVCEGLQKLPSFLRIQMQPFVTASFVPTSILAARHDSSALFSYTIAPSHPAVVPGRLRST
jgi:hypothetical protein